VNRPLAPAGPSRARGDARAGWLTLCEESPGSEGGDPKDQDRARVIPGEDVIACVCDGVTTSPHAAAAAETIAASARGIVGDGRQGRSDQALRRAAERLLWLRGEATRRHADASTAPADTAEAWLAQAAHEQLLHSYQTTMVAVAVGRRRGGLTVEYARCGDSELLVFDRDGSLLYASCPTTVPPGATGAGPRPGIASAGAERFGSRSTRTDVLPDDIDRTQRGRRLTPQGARVVIASDGFVGSFPGPGEMHRWLDDFIALSRTARDAALSELHERLRARAGDDDISFVVVQRRRRPPSSRA